MRDKFDISRKVTGATVGAALGEILSAGLIEGLGLDWWPRIPTTIVLTFVVGYLVPEKSSG